MLLHGIPATVAATSDVLCYKLDREAFAAAIQRRPALWVVWNESEWVTFSATRSRARPFMPSF